MVTADMSLQSQLTGTNTARRAQLTELLQAHTVSVTFTKTNGETRTMPCTLKPDLLPLSLAQLPNSNSNTKPLSESVITVWCTDKQAWRSFRLDSVTAIHIY